MASLNVKNTQRMREIEARIAEIDSMKAGLVAARSELMGSQKIVCPCCNKKSKVADVYFIPEYNYRPSYSSYEDSSWDFRGRYHSVCPFCFKGFYFTDNAWSKEFEPFSKQIRVGRLQFLLGESSYYRDRKGKVSLMVSNTASAFGDKEYLIPNEVLYSVFAGRTEEWRRYG